MSRRLRSVALREESPSLGDNPSPAASGVRPSVPGLFAQNESDLPPPFMPRAVDRNAGRYFESSRPPASKMHVLIVEDDEGIRSGIEQVVADAGHAVASAMNLTEARVYLAVAMPDVMILDLNLDGEFGGDLLAELTSLRDAPATVLLSAYPFAGLVADRYGIELVRKPFGIDELTAAIERARSLRRRPHAPVAAVVDDR